MQQVHGDSAKPVGNALVERQASIQLRRSSLSNTFDEVYVRQNVGNDVEDRPFG
jgi:hypothetical protein